MKVSFDNPHLLWFLFSIPLLIVLHFLLLRKTNRKAVLFANFEAIRRVTGERVLSKNIFLLVIRIFIMIFLIFSASGIVIWYEGQTSNFNYILAIDVSSSMLADDLQPNRLFAAKEAAALFVQSMTGKTKIGIVSFAGTSMVKQKLSDDVDGTLQNINNLTISQIGGTDIGEAIVTSTNLLVQEEKARTVILLTDGIDNVGTPLEEGLKHAIDKRVIIHTIGVGSEEGGRFLGTDLVSKMDPESLQQIAESTGGSFYQAQNEAELQQAYQSIMSESTEQIPIRLAFILLLAAIILVFVDWGLVNTKYRTLP